MFDALRVRGAAYLLLTALIGRLPSAMSSLAIVRLVRDGGGSYGTASLLTAVYVVVGTIGQPLLSRAIDRTGRPRPVLIGSAVVTTLALVALAFEAVDAPALGVLLAAVAGFATPPLESCLRSLWVRLMTPGAQLHAAFSLDAAAQELVFVAGPLVTALGILFFGAQGNILLMAALGLLGTLAFAAHGRSAASAPATVPVGGHHGSPIGIRSFRHLALVQLAVGVPIGVLTISATGYGELVHGESVSAIALAINAGGAFVGALLIARFPVPSPHRAIRWLALSVGLLYVPTAFVHLPVPAWLAAAFVAGLSLPPLLTQMFAQTPRTVPEAQLNEANAWIVSAFTVGIAGGTLLAGFVVEAVPGASGLTLSVLLGSAITVLGALSAWPSAVASAAPASSER